MVTSLGGTSPVNVTTGSGDDTFTVTGSGQIAFNFNGGAGQNHFVGDFSQDALLTLDSTPVVRSMIAPEPESVSRVTW